MGGLWHEYMTYNDQIPGGYENLSGYWMPIGMNDLSGVSVGTSTNETRTISGVLMNVTLTLNGLPSQQCGGLLEVAFVTNDGQFKTLAQWTYNGTTIKSNKHQSHEFLWFFMCTRKDNYLRVCYF